MEIWIKCFILNHRVITVVAFLVEKDQVLEKESVIIYIKWSRLLALLFVSSAHVGGDSQDVKWLKMWDFYPLFFGFS